MPRGRQLFKKKRKKKSSHCITPERKWKLELAGQEEEFLGFIFLLGFVYGLSKMYATGMQWKPVWLSQTPKI